MIRLVSILAGLLVAATCEASLDLSIPLPYDNREAKVELWRDSTLDSDIEADRDFYWKLEGRLRKLSEDRLIELFGPPLPEVPLGYALPIHHHIGVGFSGLGYLGNGGSYFLEVPYYGGILVFPFGNGKSVSSVAIYLKVDLGFVPFLSRSDYLRRRGWELLRGQMLKSYLNDVLSK